MCRGWCLVASRWPEIKATASALHTDGMIRIIQNILGNRRLHFVSPHSINEHTTLLEQQRIICRQCPPNEDSFDKFLEAENPEVVIFDRFIMEEQFSWKLKPDIFRILDTQDLYFLRQERMKYTKHHLKIAPEYPKISVDNVGLIRELSSIHRSDLVLVVSSFEKDYLISEYGINEQKILVAPFFYNTGDSSWSTEDYSTIDDRKHFVMLGNFLHPPNVDALEWASKSLWRNIRKELPDAELHVYGAYPTKHAKSLERRKEGLFVHGQVSSLEPLFRKYRVNFAPLRFGAGIKGKITDGWFHGIPCITTRIGAEGLNPTRASFGGYVTNSEEEITEAAREIYRNNDLWINFVKNGKNIIESHFSMKNTGETFKEQLLSKIQQKEQLREKNLFGAILSYNTNRATEFMSRYIEIKNTLEKMKDKTPQDER